jgi:hypothetical protein
MIGLNLWLRQTGLIGAWHDRWLAPHAAQFSNAGTIERCFPSPLQPQGAGHDEPLYAERDAGLHITGLISLTAGPAFSYSSTWSFSIGAWAGWLCLALTVGLIILVTTTHSRNKGAAEARSGFKLESDLQQ